MKCRNCNEYREDCECDYFQPKQDSSFTNSVIIGAVTDSALLGGLLGGDLLGGILGDASDGDLSD